MFRCKNKIRDTYINSEWKFIKKAWLPVISVCNQFTSNLPKISSNTFYTLYAQASGSANIGAYELCTMNPITAAATAVAPWITEGDEYQESIAWNPNDKYMYHTSNSDSILFHKMNLNTLEVTTILVTGGEGVDGTSVTTTSYITFGGGNMYSGGNILSTNLVNGIAYTHTQQSDPDPNLFSQIADGVVTDGTSLFGSGSTYFTNMYSGLFVLVAKNITINQFNVDGTLGNNFSIVDSGTFHLTIDAQLFTIFYKSVFDESDASVNHIMIVPGNGSGVTHDFSRNCNSDRDKLSGLSGVSSFYYLLTASVGQLSLIDIQNMATAFLNIASPASNITALLNSLNTNVTNITSENTNPYIFTDYESGSATFTIGAIPGLSGSSALMYKSPGVFWLTSGTGLFELTTDGVASLKNEYQLYFSMTGITELNNVVYGVSQFTSYLAKFDSSTGDPINLSPDTKYDTTITYNGDPIGGGISITTYNNMLYAIVYYESGKHLGSIDPDTGVFTLIADLTDDFLALATKTVSY